MISLAFDGDSLSVNAGCNSMGGAYHDQRRRAHGLESWHDRDRMRRRPRRAGQVARRVPRGRSRTRVGRQVDHAEVGGDRREAHRQEDRPPRRAARRDAVERRNRDQRRYRDEQLDDRRGSSSRTTVASRLRTAAARSREPRRRTATRSPSPASGRSSPTVPRPPRFRTSTTSQRHRALRDRQRSVDPHRRRAGASVCGPIVGYVGPPDCANC